VTTDTPGLAQFK